MADRSSVTSTSVAQRVVERVVRGIPASDGAGVRLNRVIGQPGFSELDPFLLLDEFRSDNPGDYIAGFPEHPHRGFETVTYLIAGRVRHEDNKGHKGLLTPGSVQWMTAGRGIVHSEMPEQEDGLLQGFQLWVNLPRRSKMTEPRYQEYAPGEIPEVTLDNGARARVIAGGFADKIGPIDAVATAPLGFLRLGLHDHPEGHACGAERRRQSGASRRRERGAAPGRGGQAAWRAGGALRTVRHELGGGNPPGHRRFPGGPTLNSACAHSRGLGYCPV